MTIYQRIGEGFGDGAFFVRALTEKKLFRYCIALIETKQTGLLTNRNRILRESRNKDIFLLCLFSFFSKEGKMTKKEAETYLY